MRKRAFVFLLALTACPMAPEAVVPPKPPPPAPPPIVVPPGCDANLAGTYHHQDDDSFRYAITDDGLDVKVHAYRQFGSTVQPIASAAADFALRRTPQGLVGEAVMPAATPSGSKSCSVKFPYEVAGCSPTSLVLRVVGRFQLDENCQLQEPEREEIVLVRLAEVIAAPASGAPDAGTSDAGLPPPAAQALKLESAPILDAGASVNPGFVDAGAPAVATAPTPPPSDAGAPVTQGVAADGGNALRP